MNIWILESICDDRVTIELFESKKGAEAGALRRVHESAAQQPLLMEEVGRLPKSFKKTMELNSDWDLLKVRIYKKEVKS